MPSLNKVTLICRLGKTPEKRITGTGDSVTTISVATSKNWKDKNTGQVKEQTEWHRVVFFKKLADIAAQYLTKGSLVYLEGELRTRKWEKDGITHYTTEIIANEMKMLDSKQTTTSNDAFNSEEIDLEQDPY
jgi:single-strand DNA-binding protein